MQSAIIALSDAVTQEAMLKTGYDISAYPSAFGRLTVLAAWLIEGNTEQKKHARKELQRLIAKGRRIDLQRAALQKQTQEQPE